MYAWPSENCTSAQWHFDSIWHIFWRSIWASILTFYLAYARVQACATARGAGDMAWAQWCPQSPGQAGRRRRGKKQKKKDKEKKEELHLCLNLKTLAWQVGKYLLDLTQMLWMPRVSYPLVMFIVRMFYPESTSCNVHSRKDILEDQKQHVSSKAAMRTCSTTDKRQSLFSYCTTTLFRMQYPYQKEALLQRGAFFFWRSFPAHVHTQKV